jgi:sphingomyelin phosphodiesterase acid-like 3
MLRCWSCLLLFLSHTRSISSSSSSSSGKFLWLSDLHLEPFYGKTNAFQLGSSTTARTCNRNESLNEAPYGQRRCDSPRLLINAALQESLKVLPEPDFLLVTGDFVRHGNEYFNEPLEETQSILAELAHLLLTIFPRTSILPVLGNNDVTPDYYLDLEDSNSNNTLLNMATDAFSDLFMTEQETITFRQGGYFARNVSSTLTILSINTVMYAVNHKPEQTYMKDPLFQFEWLQGQLTMARKESRKVYVTGHIPPVVGSYAQKQLWHQQYSETYYSILNRHPGIVASQLFGHLHTDEFRAVVFGGYDELPPPPLLIASSITPIYGSNPSFRVVTYSKDDDDDNGLILDYDTYFLDLEETFDENTSSSGNSSSNPAWQKMPSFQESFGVPDLSASSLQMVVQNLMNTSNYKTTLAAFLSRQHVNATDAESSSSVCAKEPSSCRLEWICTLQSSSRLDFDRCMKETKPPQTTSSKIMSRNVVYAAIIIGLLVASVMMSLVVCLKRYLKRLPYQPQQQEQHDRHNGGVVSARGEDDDDNTIYGDIMMYQSSDDNGVEELPLPPKIS